jgi:sialate O-acetylesterase
MASQLWLPSFISSGMILQQKVSCLLRGQTRPAAEVRLTLERSTFDGRPVSPMDNQYGIVADLTVYSDDLGAFLLELPAFEASFDPFCLKLSDGRQEIKIDDILFGEVWVASGQSNMRMPLNAVVTADQLPILANMHYIRVLQQSETGLGKHHSGYGYHPADDVCDAHWLYGDQPDRIADISAVAFQFARELHLELRIPIGLIETSMSGSQIHSWLDRDTIEQQPALKKHIQEQGFYRSEADWNMAIASSWASCQPTALFNHKIVPLQGLGARGILWYQGESDYQYPAYYQKALPAMIRAWNLVFRPADSQGLVFLYVQLAPYYYGHSRFCQLAEFNEMLAAVRRSLPVPAGLVTIYDLPPVYDTAPDSWRHPNHPTLKLPIGQRLKTIAMGLAYQLKAPSSAPECTDIEVVGNKMLLSFGNIGEGLRLCGEDNRLHGFTICGPDRVFVEASARILYGVRVLIWSDQVPEPCAVTYAFADMNSAANLISRDQLPVVPFRSDRELSRYCPPQEWTHCESLQVWSCPGMERINETGWHPAWRVERGLGELKVEKANKAEGDGSLFFRYQSSDGYEFGIEPLLQHDSMFPPLDLSYYHLLSVDVFNTDQQMKHLRLALACGPSDSSLQPLTCRITILPALRWQRLQFDLRSLDEEALSTVRRLVFIVEDRTGKGTLYLDQIQLIHTDDLRY